MKTYFRLFLIIFTTGIIFSCSEDFLDEDPTEFISQDQISDVATYYPPVLDGFLAGGYSTTIARFLIGGGRHYDFGHRGVDVITDMLSNDMALGGLNFQWYSDVTNYGIGLDFGLGENNFIWTYFYRIIFSTNTVIDSFETIPDNASARHTLGQALALRAYAYTYLAQIYQNQYDPSEAILPLYLSVGPNGPAAPMSEVYEAIESDLITAIDLLADFNRPTKESINADVSKGLLAYAYAAQGKYDLALPVCQDIVNNGGYVPVQGNRLYSGFNDINDEGWMWGVDLIPVHNHNLVSWWGKVDIFSFSYAWAGDPKPIDQLLYDAMRPDDKRRFQFGECDVTVVPQCSSGNNPHGYGDFVPTQKFYNPDRTIGGSSADNNEMDYVFMRVAEFHILGAESAYKTGNEILARQLIKQLVSLRVDDASYIDALSGQALLDEILMQTRWELWGEGKSYFSFKRNNETRTRGANHILLAGETISASEERTTLPLPQNEVINNPFID